MAIALIFIAALIAIAVTFELMLCLIACHERNRFDSLPPAVQRKYQEDMYKAQAMANS